MRPRRSDLLNPLRLRRFRQKLPTIPEKRARLAIFHRLRIRRLENRMVLPGKKPALPRPRAGLRLSPGRPNTRQADKTNFTSFSLIQMK